MYKVLLVDDEVMNFQLFEKLVDWEAKGFVIAGTAQDGQEALRQYELLSPDLILMDIQLPLMDGLECVRCIREEDTRTRIVIVSAYDDFSYAQRAIRYGVQDYLLKPVSRLLLGQLVDRVKADLDSRKEGAAQAESVFGTKLARQLKAALAGGTEAPDLDGLSVWGLTLTKEDGFFSEGEELFGFLEKLFGNSEDCHVGENDSGLACIALSGSFPMEELRDLCVKHGLRFQLYPMDGQERSTWFARLTSCQSYGFYENGSGVYSLEKEPFHSPAHRIRLSGKSISQAVAANSCEQLCVDLDRLLDTVFREKTDPAAVKEDLMDLLLQIKFLLNQFDREEVFYFMRGQKPETIYQFQSMNALKAWILDRVRETFAQINEVFFRGGSSLVPRTNALVEASYRDPAFSTADAAAYNGISKNYFTGLYKEQAGIGFWEYVTERRMQKAQELLLTTQELVSTIGSSVGYESEYHFSRKFKEYTGESPGQFRKNHTRSTLPKNPFA